MSLPGQDLCFWPWYLTSGWWPEASYSRKVVGWHIGESLHTDLIVAALEMAAQARKPQSVIHHSDQGCQYTSVAFGKRCKELNVRPSTG